MKLLFLLGVALGTMACVQAQACDTQAKINELNAEVQTIANTLVPLQNNGANLTVVLTTLCDTNTTKKAAENLQSLIGGCVALLTQPALDQLQFSNITFTQFMTDFSSLEQMCSCAPYLELAYAMTTIPITMSVAGGAYPTLGSAATVCYNGDQNSIPALLPKNLLGFYVNNMARCPILWKFTGFVSEDQLRRTHAFSRDLCPRYNYEATSCTIQKSATDEFRDCIMKAKSITGDMAKEKIECSNYECVEDHMDTCTEDARRIFRFTANILLTRPADNAMFIGEEECSAASTRHVSMLLLTSLITMWFLK